jgi:hypothetical protein
MEQSMRFCATTYGCHHHVLSFARLRAQDIFLPLPCAKLNCHAFNNGNSIWVVKAMPHPLIPYK